MTLRRTFKILFWIAAFVTLIAIINDSYGNAWDFRVFYVAARELFAGRSPYGVGMESGWVFKYPPWILPLFIPFSFFPFDFARILWGIFQAACIFVSFRWVLRQGVSFAVTAWISLAFWFVWTYHALSGQFTVVMLAIALLAVDSRTLRDSSLKASARLALLTWSQTSKMFSAFSLLGLLEHRLPKRRTGLQHLGVIFLGILLTTLPAVLLSTQTSITGLFKDWIQAAGSSSRLETMDLVARSWRNQGLPAAFLRLFQVEASALWLDVTVFLVLAIVCGITWAIITKKQPWSIRWSGWLAIGTAIHPLAWFSSYVLAFPLACFAIEQAFVSAQPHTPPVQKKLQKLLAIMGLLMITIVTKSSLSLLGLGAFGRFLELASVKAWGVILCAASFIFIRDASVVAPPKVKKVHFITGPINTGKTTRFRALFLELRKQPGFSGGGFVLEKSQAGYDAVNLNSDEHCSLIRKVDVLPQNWNEAFRFSKFSFSKEGLNFCRAIYEQSVAQKHQVFFIDEIGPVELREQGFFELLREALQTMDEVYLVCRSSCVEDVIQKFQIPEEIVHEA